jgi:hypothetical protein
VFPIRSCARRNILQIDYCNHPEKLDSMADNDVSPRLLQMYHILNFMHYMTSVDALKNLEWPIQSSRKIIKPKCQAVAVAKI